MQDALTSLHASNYRCERMHATSRCITLASALWLRHIFYLNSKCKLKSVCSTHTAHYFKQQLSWEPYLCLRKRFFELINLSKKLFSNGLKFCFLSIINLLLSQTVSMEMINSKLIDTVCQLGCLNDGGKKFNKSPKAKRNYNFM